MLNITFGDVDLDITSLKSFKSLNAAPFFAGDVLGVSFRNRGYSFAFEGLCLAIRGKSLVTPESSLIIRNVIGTTGIEVTFSYFYNRGFLVRLNDFKRKKLSYSRAKLFYVRHKLNIASRV